MAWRVALWEWWMWLKYRNLHWPCICKGGTTMAGRLQALYMDAYQCNNCLGFAPRLKFIANLWVEQIGRHISKEAQSGELSR
jgi:hypothetical protein